MEEREYDDWGRMIFGKNLWNNLCAGYVEECIIAFKMTDYAVLLYSSTLIYALYTILDI